jgi:hypothetical protein
VKAPHQNTGWYLFAVLTLGCGGVRPIPSATPKQTSPVPQQPIVVPPLISGSWSLKYSPGTISYQISRSAGIELVSDSSSHRESATNNTHELLTLEPSADTDIGFTAVIDTFSTTTQGLVGTVQTVQLPVRLTGFLTRDSLVIASQSTNQRCSPATSALITDLYNILTPFPTQLSSAMSWKDSVEIAGCQAAIPTISHTTRSYSVAGEVLYNGRSVVEIHRTDTTRSRGEGGLQQHRVVLEATGTGNAIYYIDIGTGRITNFVLDQELTISVTASGRESRFKQRSKQAFTIVP